MNRYERAIATGEVKPPAKAYGVRVPKSEVLIGEWFSYVWEGENGERYKLVGPWDTPYNVLGEHGGKYTDCVPPTTETVYVWGRDK